MKKKANKKGGLLAIVALVIIIAVIAIPMHFRAKPINQTEISELNNKEEVAIDEKNSEEEQPKEARQAEPEEKQENDTLKGEASFGKLDVPVYKKSEKNIKLPLLIYHGFCTPEPEDDVYKLMCTKDRFENQIKTLLDDGYTFITLEDIYKYQNNEIGLPEKNITITMDDGWDGNYLEAFEIIKKYKVPATIFVVENLVGTAGYFSWEQAKEMYDSGLVKIHVHGRKHVNATGYNKEELISDYNHAHDAIEKALGTKVQKIMAYPAGASDENTIKWLKEAGFEVQVQTKYGTVNKSNKLDLTGLGRIRAEKASGTSILKTINSSQIN